MPFCILEKLLTSGSSGPIIFLDSQWKKTWTWKIFTVLKRLCVGRMRLVGFRRGGKDIEKSGSRQLPPQKIVRLDTEHVDCPKRIRFFF